MYRGWCASLPPGGPTSKLRKSPMQSSTHLARYIHVYICIYIYIYIYRERYIERERGMQSSTHLGRQRAIFVSLPRRPLPWVGFTYARSAMHDLMHSGTWRKRRAILRVLLASCCFVSRSVCCCYLE